MQLFILALFIGVHAEELLAHGLAEAWLPWNLRGWSMLAVVAIPKLLLAAAYALACVLTLKQLSRRSVRRPLRRLERFTALYRWAGLIAFYFDLTIGGLEALRQATGATIFLNELFIILPPLAMLMWSWWCYYPIDRWIRNAQLISRIDEGLPVYPVWSRRQYMVAQLRYQVALLFVPLALLLALSQTIEEHVPNRVQMIPFDPRPALQLCGAGCIFLLAPVMIRHLWNTLPLPAGPLRNHLAQMCARYRVGVRELLIWQTFGGMVNAAVMGLISPFRYILLSDALLEMVSPREVEAVMAHELAHVCRRHMVWLIGSTVALMAASAAVGWTIIAVITKVVIACSPELTPGWTLPNTDALMMGVSIVGWLLGFGWISRRFERQADAFAVRHLSISGALPDLPVSSIKVDKASAMTMVNALEQVCRLNNLDRSGRSWRHGSIRWRQQYLRSLVGHHVNTLTIDRQVFWIKFVTAVLLVAAITAAILPLASS